MAHILSFLIIITLLIIFHPKNSNMRKGIRPRKKIRVTPQESYGTIIQRLYEDEINPELKKHYEKALDSLSSKN